MPNRLLIQSDPYQIRAAVFEEGRLAEIYLEHRGSRGVVGNVYKGRVSRVLPGMQAAFVDIGLERDAFLYAGDVRDPANPRGQVNEAESNGEEAVEADPAPRETRPIEELVEAGRELLVQVVKEPLHNKGARITTEITLPGRYLVLVPETGSLGVSRRIQEVEERDRLRGVLEGLSAEGHGMIVRTAGEGRQREDFEGDLAYLARTWESLRRRAASLPAPALIHQDLNLALRTIRDRLDESFERVEVDGRELFDSVVEVARETEPGVVDRIRLYEPPGSLFDAYKVEAAVDAALRSRVWLPSGGYIVINPTEALVAIDVNTGRFVGRKNLEDTVVRTNLEAVCEIVRQIRLRDLSGIIVVDFIDMNEPTSRAQVSEALTEELKKDRAKNQVLTLSDFGLVEITRKRSRSNLQGMLTRPCPQCSGRGRILSATTVCLRLRRQVLRERQERGVGALTVRVHPEVAEALRGELISLLDELEEIAGAPVEVVSASEIHPETYELTESPI
jgi:ribonuclease G